MFTFLVIIMCLWTVCFIIAWTAAECNNEDLAEKWYGISSFLVFALIWFALFVTVLPLPVSKIKEPEQIHPQLQTVPSVSVEKQP